MKVGILTLHTSINYGAVLQAFALQKNIESLGHQCEIINYTPFPDSFLNFGYSKQLPDKNGVSFFKSGRTTVKDYLQKQGFYPIREWEKQKIFQEFGTNFLHLSDKRYCLNDNLDELENNYDIIITGSDQVWNFPMLNYDRTYFLTFVKDSRKKNAYSASFGMSELPDYLEPGLARYLQDFNHISVRENSAVKILKNILHRDVPQTVDPTLLMDSQQWSSISYPVAERNYILYFPLIYSDSLESFAVNLAQKKGLKIIHIGSIIKSSRLKYCYRFPSPNQFLSLFENANCIVTNSFHGSVFATIYNKEFYIQRWSGVLEKRNSRFDSFFNTFELGDRFISPKGTEGLSSIDYQPVNLRIEQERQKSIEYLKSILE